MAWKTARLYEQLRQNLQGLTALSGLGLAINTPSATPQVIWQFTVGGIIDSTGAMAAGVLMCTDVPEQFDQVLTLGQPHIARRGMIAAGQPGLPARQAGPAC